MSKVNVKSSKLRHTTCPPEWEPKSLTVKSLIPSSFKKSSDLASQMQFPAYNPGGLLEA